MATKIKSPYIQERRADRTISSIIFNFQISNVYRTRQLHPDPIPEPHITVKSGLKSKAYFSTELALYYKESSNKRELVDGAFKRAQYCVQGNKVLQTKKAGGKQTRVLETYTVSKGEIRDNLELRITHARGNNFKLRKDKWQGTESSQKIDDQQVMRVEESDSVPTEIKPKVT